MNKKEISGPRGTEALTLILAGFGEGGRNCFEKSAPSEQGTPGHPRSTGERVQSQPAHTLEVHNVVTNRETSPFPRGREKGQGPIIGPPILPGWLVAYRGPDGKLRGGCDDREHGTVETGERREAAWTFTLTDGRVLPARAIVSVAQVAQNGRIVAAWTVRNFGLDGERQCVPWRVSESDR